jgi:hypothetical protein
VAADAGTNPRNLCSASAQSTCGNDGFCDGAGACRNWASTTVCKAAGCANGAVSAQSMCSGTGVCNAGAATSCGAYACDAGGLTCRTTCAVDSDCGGFCSATTCFAAPVNLAGNGNLEYGTTSAWSTNGGGTLVLQDAQATPTPGPVQAGRYSIADTVRTAGYMGPGYLLPTGAGQYAVEAWVMQNENPTQKVALQVALQCGTSFQDFPTIGTYGLVLTQGVWTKVTGTVNLAANPACQTAATPTPGVVRSALLYVNTTEAGTPVVQPNLFIDSVVVTADGHNLVGNPNFEVDTVTSGWQNNGGGTLATATTAFRSGARSLALTGRTQSYNGPRWNLPIGAAKYNVTVYALHAGGLPHDLVLQPTYTCLGSGAQFPAPIATVLQAGGNGWNQLSGTVTFPPADAPVDCKLISAGVYVQTEGASCGANECPDLFVDDVSITLAP